MRSPDAEWETMPIASGAGCTMHGGAAGSAAPIGNTNGRNAAAAALGFVSVQALQDAIETFCEG